ncbi:trehalase family glycosidase [Paenibacillus filicis]|uniref:Trehalase family glycosidase n=1 Tax=Paenibacillus gyeongsangnamensis TaxID=3388067 RepID=A0ABT4QEY0_9BACL|nr:trehalase family glycosidase [Paenibacillus filicis]MCZ8515426.1 trehalase family glycosidase [Paenibacillus filicis]
MEALKGTHDLPQLPAWGPYTKKYMGLSHIADSYRGIRFDLSVFPGFYRRKVDVPNVMWESGYHPREAAPDLSYFMHRHEMEWKDRVYADVAFAALSDHTRLVRAELVNRTEQEQNLVLHLMGSLHFPELRSHGPVLQCDKVVLPSKAVWADALDYSELQFAAPRPSDNLVYDGWYRGEIRGHGFVGGSGLGKGFGLDKGDQVAYDIETPGPYEHAVLLIRYRMEAGATLRLSVRGDIEALLELKGSGELMTERIDLGPLHARRLVLRLISNGGAELMLDGLVVTEHQSAGEVRFERENRNQHPTLLPGPVRSSLILKYEGLNQFYGILWNYPDYEVREFHCDELDRFMRHTVYHHVNSVLKGEGEGHFTNVFLRPIRLQPGSSKRIYAIVVSGSLQEVEEALSSGMPEEAECEEVFEEARARVPRLESTPAGDAFRFSQQLMAATLLTNVVYPVYTRRSYIRHNTPGRWWDSLYTWDSGFIGLGLAELNIRRAVECLNAYLTESGDPHAAFIHHGSMVPVQLYLFLELWNKTRSSEMLHSFYPKLRQYYQFYAGKTGSSTTSALPSHLLKTWDYFYNSGGWDDYPPQVAVHREGLTGRTAPVSNTSHAIRIAKILKMAAAAIGNHSEDILEYDEDIDRFREAIQQNAWDEAEGYFGYVLHDEEGKPVSLLRHPGGQNYNMGLDGAYPLIAGICSAEQEKRLLTHLSDSSRLWSPIGLSTVDQSAAYYRLDGYWNGAVWMPHQWFYWKALLGLGHGELARRIALTALALWEKEVRESYHCFEHFIIESGRGAGWHHFGGLSSPVLCWFHAYYTPGTFTAGFDVWIHHFEFHEGKTEMTASLSHNGESGRKHLVLACMNGNGAYSVTWNGVTAEFKLMDHGLLEIRLPTGCTGELVIRQTAVGHGVE